MANNHTLKKLRREDLLEILLEVRKENEQLKEENQNLKQQLEDRSIQIGNAGSLADAALQLNGVFEAAQAACSQYEQNVRERCDRMEQATKEKCKTILIRAYKKAKQYENSENEGNTDG